YFQAPCLVEEEKTKKIKIDNQSSEAQEPNAREYLQLALNRIIEMQRSVNNEDFDDNTSELGNDDTDENVMREVLTKVFKDLPGSSKSVASIIERATKPLPAEYNRVRAKGIQLSGYDTCRRVAVDFMQNIVKHTPKYSITENNVIINDFSRQNGSRRCETLTNEYELRNRMLTGLDLHLAVKQRDYTMRLMRF
ncbi:GSCOCG00013018001-RA-CDS, partial [Cotesia congregata]